MQRMQKIFHRTGCNYWLVDAFTRKPFAGNPASVILLPAAHTKEEKWMQSVASEINSPVTCFLDHLKDNNFMIRWFTPTKELELCGHATIASSHVIYNECKLVTGSESLRFQSRFCGIITVKAETGIGEEVHDDKNMRIELSFPLSTIVESSLTPDDYQAIGSCFKVDRDDLLFVGKTAYDLVLVVKSEVFHAMPSSSTIDFNEVKKINTSRGIIITTTGNRYSSAALKEFNNTNAPAVEDKKYDYFLRMFLPRYGINEDFVSGSAFSAMAPYWTTFLMEKNHLGESPRGRSLLGYQASGRGGEVLTTVSDDDSRVYLSGSCRTVMSGNWTMVETEK
jgi:PhzF family phenazine biosynthesis protein